MKSRPRVLTFLSQTTMAMVLLQPFLAVLIYDNQITLRTLVKNPLFAYTCILLVLGVLTSVLYTRASPALKGVLPLFIVMLVTEGMVSASDPSAIRPMLIAGVVTTFVSFHLLLLTLPVRTLIRRPDLRWWLNAKRDDVRVPVFLGGYKKDAFRSETYDVSETGAFVRLHPDSVRNKLNLDDSVTLCFTFGTYSQFRCDGRVVRISEPQGRYPAGLGIEFVGLGSFERRELRQHLARVCNGRQAQAASTAA